MNRKLSEYLDKNKVEIDVELDEMWSFVGSKGRKVWIWLAYHRKSRQILAWTVGDRSSETLDKLLELLKVFKIRRHYTDNFMSYGEKISKENRMIGKIYTQGIERMNLTLRNFVRRLNRKTICYSRRLDMHVTAIYLVIRKLFYFKDEKEMNDLFLFPNINQIANGSLFDCLS